MHNKVMRRSWESYQKVIRKSWQSHDKFIRSTPLPSCRLLQTGLFLSGYWNYQSFSEWPNKWVAAWPLLAFQATAMVKKYLSCLIAHWTALCTTELNIAQFTPLNYTSYTSSEHIENNTLHSAHKNSFYYWVHCAPQIGYFGQWSICKDFAI